MRIAHKHYTAPPVDTGLDLFELGVPDPFPVTLHATVLAPSVAVDTSREAASRIAGHTSRIREAIFLWLKTQGSHGATRQEISDALGLSGDTVRPRLIELSGTAKWAKGLPVRIQRSPEKRGGMRIYVTRN